MSYARSNNFKKPKPMAKSLPSTPAAWKLWLLRWLGLYSTLLTLYATLRPLISSWPTAARVFVMKL